MAKWNQEEIEILKNNKDIDKIKLLLPNRSLSAIKEKMKEIEILNIGIKKDYSIEDIEKIFKHKNYKLISIPSSIDGFTKIKYICNNHIDKGEQEIDVNHLYRGRGCYYCGREKTENARKIKIDKVSDKEVAEDKGFEYIDTKRENGLLFIYFICPKHKELGVQCMNRFYFLNKASGCKYCHGHTPPEWYIVKKIEEINPYIELLEPYENLTKRIKCRCKKHNHISTKSVQEILAGRGCKFCGAEKVSEQKYLTNDEVQRRVSEIHPHIKLIEYKGSHDSSSLWWCTKHNKIFNKTLSAMLKTEDSGCDLCYKETMWKNNSISQQEFEERLKRVHPEISLEENYKGYNVSTLFYCAEHNHYFNSTPAYMLKRRNCCQKSFKTYKEEKMCCLLEDWGFDIIRQKSFDKCKDKNILRFDCYLKGYNTVIEYDGENHYYPVRFGTQSYESAKKKHEYTVEHDKIKNEFCRKNNINIIRLPYYEFHDMEYFLFDKLSEFGIIEEVKAS